MEIVFFVIASISILVWILWFFFYPVFRMPGYDSITQVEKRLRSLFRENDKWKSAIIYETERFQEAKGSLVVESKNFREIIETISNESGLFRLVKEIQKDEFKYSLSTNGIIKI